MIVLFYLSDAHLYFHSYIYPWTWLDVDHLVSDYLSFCCCSCFDDDGGHSLGPDSFVPSAYHFSKVTSPLSQSERLCLLMMFWRVASLETKMMSSVDDGGDYSCYCCFVRSMVAAGTFDCPDLLQQPQKQDLRMALLSLPLSLKAEHSALLSAVVYR